MNYSETKELLIRYLVARIPFIGISTIEKTRTLSLLKEISKETNTKDRKSTRLNSSHIATSRMPSSA